MIRSWRAEHAGDAQPLDDQAPPGRICVCVRKRPISEKERQKDDHDSITCFNPIVWVHTSKFRVDGITKYLDHTPFEFDHAFDETVDNDVVYLHTAMPLMDFACRGVGGRATCFAYGQTGSGKTHTMNGIQLMLREDLFILLSNPEEEGACSLKNTDVLLAFFELYNGRVQDLLNNGQRLKLLEDGKGEINITGLRQVPVTDPESFSKLLEEGNNARTTHMTEANDTSSRSHAICQIVLLDKETKKLKGKLSLVDLAGSERGDDTKSHNSQRRQESKDINASLLSLKECIRALEGADGTRKAHVPYRGSKLTLLLKDCFTSPRAMTTMIATVSPGASAADHSLNTLRYADRIKEKRKQIKKVTASKNTTTNFTSKEMSNVKSQQDMQQKPKAVTRTSGFPEDEKSNKSLDRSEADPQITEELLIDLHDSEEESVGSLLDEGDLLNNDGTSSIREQQKDIVKSHKDFIRAYEELLSMEGEWLELIQPADVTSEEIEEYARNLGDILDQKQSMINDLHEKMIAFREETVNGQQT